MKSRLKIPFMSFAYNKNYMSVESYCNESNNNYRSF